MRTAFPATALALALAVTLTACTTATPYQPLDPRSATAGGYSDLQIEDSRYRVSFAGNSMTSRETVETYLLFRAAELTVSRGYDWFVMADRDTEKRSQVYADRPFGPGPYGYWGPRWHYWGRGGLGWRSWDPFWGDPFWDRSIDIRTVDRYEATAEIVMGKGPKPADNVRAFDARWVISNLRTRIVQPK
ncbi:MAG: hypothetical protein QHC67_02895 [Sphingobium sp.]|uniref:CC0125/CC1285 family lipoprotein n=1 Tax=Sphingobium sp. TaxID=1912891 RepID=UPI00299F918A|nr:hypothetical protein [Sphingobium sp.]MDX3908746.1 hypothetical protein [Sphingobium sp.]